MDGGSTTLIAIFLLLVLHALIVLGSSSISNARPAQMRNLAGAGNVSAQKVLKFSDQGDRLRLTVMVLTTALQVAIATLALLFVSAQTSAMPLWLVYLLTGTFTVTITLALGELVPESVATLHADRLALWFAGPVHWLLVALTPVTTVLTALGTAVSGLFGSADLVNRVTEEEILTLVDAGHTGGSIEEGEKEMIYSVLTLDQTQASELMVPRIDIVAVEAKTPLAGLDKVFFESGYSRVPVYEENVDNIKGVIIAKDLLMANHNGNREKFKTAGDLVRPTVFVPETKTASELLKDLRAKRVHMAIVVDEYGGTAGLVTIEDLIEQIVGEIQDEYDDEEAEYTEIGENTWRMDASIDVDDVNDLLDVDLETHDSDTLGGLIYTQLGRVPFAGETVELDRHVQVTVDKIDGRRIRAVTVKRLYPADEADEAQEQQTPAESGDSTPQTAPET
ncbi:MAG: HlyC/CorC family transporter [Chloroflexi bacterium]|nr:HlyC/CorC family transporter [Chloroflexota bacterium]